MPPAPADAGCAPYYLHSAFQPAFELRDAKRLAAELAADLVVLEQDILKSPEVSANPAERCYHCKRVLFSSLTAAAAADGFSVLIDGTTPPTTRATGRGCGR